MRQRKKKWAQPYLDQHPLVIQGEVPSIDNDSRFSAPLFLEIGCGKGDFITNLALKNPTHHYIALELQPSVLALAVKKAEEKQLTNVHFMLVHAERIDLLFNAASFDGIYLNFSDPWPKARHAKRRLTAPQYLEKYAYILKPQGQIHFKTDNQLLYQYTLEMLEKSKFELLEKQENYILIDTDIETEYEKRFRSQQQPIYRLVLRKKDEGCV